MDYRTEGGEPSELPATPGARTFPAGLSVLEFHAAETLAATLRSADIEYVSLGAGPYRAELRLRQVADVQLQAVRDAPHLARGAIGPDQVLLLLPLSPLGDTRVNGAVIDETDALVFGPGAELRATAAIDLTWAAVAITPARAEALGMRVPAAGRSHLLKGVFAGRPGLKLRVAEALSPACGEAGEAALAEGLRQAMAATVGDGPIAAPSRATGRRMALVRRVDEYLEAHLGRPNSTEAICHGISVPDRSLRAAFAAVHGISPHAYLRLRRLDLVRAALRRAHPTPGRVKMVALSHGFWHLGRFSAAYRDRFGELPSQTLPPGSGTALR